MNEELVMSTFDSSLARNNNLEAKRGHRLLSTKQASQRKAGTVSSLGDNNDDDEERSPQL